MWVKPLTNYRMYGSKYIFYLIGRRTLNGGFRRISKNSRYENPCTTVIGHVVELEQGHRQHLKFIYVKLEETERGKLGNVQDSWYLITRSLIEKKKRMEKRGILRYNKIVNNNSYQKKKEDISMDLYCERYWDEKKKKKEKYLYGAAAREKRIKENGGLENMINVAGKIGAEAAIRHFLENIAKEKRTKFKVVN